MKKWIAFMLAALLLSGCSMTRMGTTPEAAEEALRQGVDSAREALETVLQTQAPTATASAPVGRTTQRLTEEQAKDIVLEHAGFAADQVTGLRVQYEIDDGIPRYEVRFRQGRWEYDYEINAQTGSILSYDRDD